MRRGWDQQLVERVESQRGFSLVEAVVAVFILSALSLMIVQSIRGLASTQVYTKGQARTIDLAERLVQDVANDARFAVKVLTESVEDRAFLDYLELPSLDILPGSKLPIVSTIGIFEPDPTAKKLTGNMLVMAKSSPFVLVDKGGNGFDSDKLRIDTFRYVIYHLMDGGENRIDMARWSGNRMASYPDLLSISNPTEQQTAALDLFRQGISIAWDLNAAAATAFYAIQPDGSIVPILSPSSKPVRRDNEQTVSHLLSPRNVEIAKNGSVTRVDVPKFAVADERYPHGFEVKIDGGGAGRLMLIRIVVARREGAVVRNSSAVVRLVSVRGL